MIKQLTCLKTWRHLAIFLAVVLTPHLSAQTNEEVFREYQFNFTLPGARATGMGGSFIGLADDATSSFSNPAGLAFLTETALTLEYRVRDLDARSDQLESGDLTIQFDQEAQSLTTSFASFNFSYNGWYFGLFQYDYLNERQDRTFQTRALINGIDTIEIRDIQLDLSGTARGFGAARRFGNWKLGLTINRLDLEGFTSYERVGFTRPIPTNRRYFSTIDDSDEDWGFNLGILHEAGTNFSWGAVWRENPRFGLLESVDETIDGAPVLVDTIDVPFVVPDVFGVGMRWRARPTFSLLMDYQLIYYSQIISDGFVIVENLGQDSEENYQIEDTGEIHMGFEWLIPGENSVYALRGGYYRNPLHAVTYSGDDPATRDRFAGTGLEDENHYTLGFGWVFRNTLELDLSANWWSVGQEITASVIWRRK